MRIAIFLSSFPFLLINSCTSLSQKTSELAKPRSVGLLTEKSFVSEDGSSFPIKKWGSAKHPQKVIIGIHGIAGAACDFTNLGEALELQASDSWLYAMELRGQGYDSVVKRRGDVKSKTSWTQDLYLFTEKVREQHPKAQIIWHGESMGSLIALHAATGKDARAHSPDALILSSPVVSIKNRVSWWKLAFLRTAAVVSPTARYSLEELSGQNAVQISEHTVHQEQVKKNPWHIEKFSLRLINTLTKMVGDMPKCAQKLHLPVLVLSGGKDVFVSKSELDNFMRQLPEGISAKWHYYPECYHLLFYDSQKERIIGDTLKWVTGLPPKPRASD